MKTRHQKRLAAEQRFRCISRAAMQCALLLLVILLATLLYRGMQGFVETRIRLPITFEAEAMGVTPEMTMEDISVSSYHQLAQQSMRSLFPAITDEAEQRSLSKMVSSASGLRLRNLLLENPDWLGTTQYLWLPAASIVDRANKSGRAGWEEAGLDATQITAMEGLRGQDAIKRRFNTGFFTSGDSRQPEQAGFLGAIVGSLLTVAACLAVAFPLGVMTAVYLEEFARKGRVVDIIEVNINNLAAVPSIVFGLLGLAVYLNLMGLPRSAPLVGGLTLALMILPVIIISTRSALGAVPDSIRHAALALGASPLQTLWHHTLRLALPGIMTGTILGLARALGETAPLLMIGMVAFMADVPTGITSPATVMPVQIYLWAGSPEAGFSEKTAAGIIVLLAVLLVLNAAAIYIRKRAEVKW